MNPTLQPGLFGRPSVILLIFVIMHYLTQSPADSGCIC